jgi:hypothetical protein
MNQEGKVMLKCKISVVLSVFLLIALLFANSALSADPQLIARWPMDENSGDVVGDVVGGHDGQFLGLPEWVDGMFESGLKFDGTAGVAVEIPRDPELEPADSMTLSVWAKLSDVTGRKDLVSYADTYAIFLEGSFRSIIHQGGNWIQSIAQMVPVVDEWYFIAMTYDSKNVNTYVNGVLEASVPASGKIQYLGPGFLFAAHPGKKYWLKGILDEVQLWDKPMTDEEIMAAYESPLPSSAVSSKGKLITIWASIKNTR